MRGFFRIYQYLGPLVLLPLAYWLWAERSGSAAFAVYALAIPVLFAYVLPAIGTNALGLWEIDTRLRLGKFRPHHGFVFGTATCVLAYPCVGPPAPSLAPGGVLAAGFVLGSVLGFWNWWYDVHAIASGHIRVYNQPYGEGRCAEAIVADYAPVYFGTFGLVYGMAVSVGQTLLVAQGRTDLFWPLLCGGSAVALVVPTLAYMGWSRLRHGHNGLRAFRPDPPTALEQSATAGPDLAAARIGPGGETGFTGGGESSKMLPATGRPEIE